MSPLCPPSGFPPHLALIWPLIWVQILGLRAWVRATYGKGTQYHWSVTPWGRVFITGIDWVPTEAPFVWHEPPAHPNARLAAALDGRAFTSDYVRTLFVGAHPGDSRDPERQRLHLRQLDPGFRRGERQSEKLRLSAGLPPPVP